MKRLLPLLCISMILYWSCEEVVEDTTPPTVSISSHSTGKIHYEDNSEHIVSVISYNESKNSTKII
jgi:hypothetical protein